MLRKVADGVWYIEDADGLPAALVTTLQDGTPLGLAEQWWTASQTLVRDLADSDTVRDMLMRPSSDDESDEG
jgi:hypothetical protein